jgi:hypothetical protein
MGTKSSLWQRLHEIVPFLADGNDAMPGISLELSA